MERKLKFLRILWYAGAFLLILGCGVVVTSFIREAIRVEPPKTQAEKDEEIVATISETLQVILNTHEIEVEDTEDIWLTNTIRAYRYLPDGTLLEEPHLNRRLLICAGKPITYIINFTQLSWRERSFKAPEEPLVQAWYDGAETLILLEKDGDWLIADGKAVLLRTRYAESAQNKNCGELEDAQAVVEAAASVTGVVMEPELHITLP